MATFTQTDDLQGAEFTDVSLRGARFVRCDLSGVVLRGAEVSGADIDAPWLLSGDNVLLVNGVNVAPCSTAASRAANSAAPKTPPPSVRRGPRSNAPGPG